MEGKGLIQPATPWFRRIHLYRIAAELTQQQVADAVGVQQRRFWGWEKGLNIPRKDHQQKLAEVLGVEVDAIFGGSTQDFTGLSRKD